MNHDLISTLRQAGHDYTDAAADQLETLRSALKRLELAGSCRENTMGDPSRLFVVKAELREACEYARDVLAKLAGK